MEHTIKKRHAGSLIDNVSRVNKRIRSEAEPVKVKQDIGSYFNLERSFRELLANSFDNHVQSNLNPAGVVISPRPTTAASDQLNTFTIHCLDESIDADAFNIGRSKKLSFRKKDGWRSVIGCFGRGMTSAHAHLVENGMSVIYETSKNVFVVISSACGGEQHEAQCVAIARQAGVNVSHGDALVLDGLADLDRTDAKLDEDHPVLDLDKLHVRKFLCMDGSDLSTELKGTKVHIVLNPDQNQREVELRAWTNALGTFLWTMHAPETETQPEPLMRIRVRSKSKLKLPVLEIYQKFSSSSDMLHQAQSVDDTSDSYSIFINHMAYLVYGEELPFTFNILIDPNAPEKPEDEIVAVSDLRTHLNDKRDTLNSKFVNAVLALALKDASKSVDNALNASGIIYRLAHSLANQIIETGDSSKMDDITSIKVELQNDLDQNRLVVLQPALISWLEKKHVTGVQLGPKMSVVLSALWQFLLKTRNNIHKAASENARQLAVEKEKRLKAQISQNIEETSESQASLQQIPHQNTDMSALETSLSQANYQALVHYPDPTIQRKVRDLIYLQQVQKDADKAATEHTIHVSYANRDSGQVDGILQSLQQRAGHFHWVKLAMTESQIWENQLDQTNIPLDLLQTLMKQGNGRAFDSVFGPESTNSKSSINWSAQRMVLYFLCRVLQSCGLTKMLDLEPADVKLPTYATESSAVGGSTSLPLRKICVPWQPPNGGSNSNSSLQFSKCDFVWFLHAAAQVLSKNHHIQGVHGADISGLHTMLYHSVRSCLKNGDVELQLTMPNSDVMHVLVLIDAWGRKFGGVSSFNMRLCETLTRCKWSGKTIVVTCVAGSVEVEPSLPGLRVLKAPQVPGLVEGDQRDRISSRLRAFDRRSLQMASESGRPMHVNLVIGHDRFTGDDAIFLAERFRALSIVIVHTVPLLIGATKTDNYCANSVDNNLRMILSKADQVVYTGNSGVSGFEGIACLHQSAPSISFQPGWFPPSRVGIPDPESCQWMMEQSPSKVLRIAAAGRLEDNLKNIGHVGALARMLQKKDRAYTELYIGMAATMDSVTRAADKQASEQVKELASRNAAVARRVAQASPDAVNIASILSAAQTLVPKTVSNERSPPSSDSLFGPLYKWYTESERDYLQLLRTCLCAVMPSLVDSYGLIAAEAAGIGMPFIVSDTSGVGQHLDSILTI